MPLRSVFPLLAILFAPLTQARQTRPAAPVIAGPPDAVRFADVTAQSRVGFVHVSSPEKRYIVESMSGGVALLDYDNDGRLDIYLVNSLTVDLVRSKGKTRSALYRNQGDGTFQDVTDRAGVGDARWSAGASFFDYDADGHLDLYVANYVAFDFANMPEFGKGKLCQYKGIPVQCGPRGLPGEGDSLYRNRGDGTFEDVTKKAGVADPNGYYGMQPIASDFDDDGRLDLFVANDSTPNFHYQNQGDGTFKEVGFLAGTAVNENGSEQGSMGVTVADYNHDGRLDLFVTNFDDDYNTLYRNDGRNTFTDVSHAARVAAVSLPYVGWGTKFFDYDNDGWVDLFVANGHVYPQIPSYRQRNFVHRNLRDGTFAETALPLGPRAAELRVGRGAAFGDLDGDGDVDIVINNLDGAALVLRNEGGSANNAVLIKTVGVKSNRGGVGARVRVVAGDLAQVDEVRSGDSYLSQSDLRLHFGLERRTRIDLIEVRWPSGAVDKVTGVGVNRILTIREGRGLVEQKEFAPPRR